MAIKVCGAPCSAVGFIVITNPIPALEKSTCRKLVIVAAMSRPAEKVKPWREYRPIFISERRIADGASAGQYTSARLSSNFSFQYGLAEVRLKLPAGWKYHLRH